MPFIKEFREFYLRSTQEPTGTKADQELGYPVEYQVLGETKFNRMLKGHFPSEGVMQKFLDSITFKLNSEDKASETEQGLAVKATDQEAYDRNNDDPNINSKTVKPSQLSDVDDDSTGDDSIKVTKAKVDFTGDERAVFSVAVSDTYKAIIQDNALQLTKKPYIYFAGADDKDGLNFELDMKLIYDNGIDTLLKPFIAILTSDTELTPTMGDFVDLWFPIGGQGGGFIMTFGAGPPSDPGTTVGDVYVDTASGQFFQVDGGLTHVPVFQVQDGADGVSSFNYIGYADDASGTNYSASPGARKYVAFRTNPTALTPVVGDFTGLWQKHIGEDGINGTNGTQIITLNRAVNAGAPSVVIFATFAQLNAQGMPNPDITNIHNFEFNIYLSVGGGNNIIEGNSMDVGFSGAPVREIDVDTVAQEVRADVQTAGDYILTVKYVGT